ncbi:hypothetical protein LTR67_005550 [Exophiala xenobiotica]
MTVSKEEVQPESVHDEISKPPDERSTSLEAEIRAYENRKLDFRTIMAIISLAFTYEASLLSFVLPAAVLLNIDNDIGPSNQLNWVATAWSLASAVTQTIAGRCSDIFGRRNFTLAGNLSSLIGCIVACRANAITTVIAGTTLTGIGSGSQLLALACANEIVPKKRRGQVFAFLSMAALPGSAFGSVIAYALVANLNWRWTLYVGILSNGVALILVGIFYWPPGFVGLHPEGKSRLQQFKELDFVGLILFGGGLTSFLFGVSWGNNPYPWRSVTVLVPLLLGALTVMVAFPLWEIYSSDDIAKLCPPKLFRNVRGFSLVLVVIFVSGMLLISLQVLWPQQVQRLFTTVSRTVGWYSLAYNMAATLGGTLAGVLFAKLKKTNWQFFTATVAQTIFISLIASVTQHTAARAIVLVAFAAFWVGASQLMGILIIQFGAEDRHIGVATGLIGSVRSTGGAIAIAIYGTIIRDKATSDIVPRVAAAAVEAGLAPSEVPSFVLALTSGSASALASIKDITPAIIAAGADAIKTVYAEAFKLVFLASLAFGVISCIAAIFVRSVDKSLTDQIAVKLEAPHLLGHGKGKNDGSA